RGEPGSVPRRLELAAALRECGRNAQAIEMYRIAAIGYAEDGRLVQAMAGLKGILAIDPRHRDTVELLADFAQWRARRGDDSLKVLVDEGQSPVPASSRRSEDAHRSRTEEGDPVAQSAKGSTPEAAVATEEDALLEEVLSAPLPAPPAVQPPPFPLLSEM